MLHPSEFAQLYTWNRFIEYFISETETEIMRDVEKIITAVKHKPLFPNTKAYHNFRQSIMDKIKALLHYFKNNV